MTTGTPMTVHAEPSHDPGALAGSAIGSPAVPRRPLWTVLRPWLLTVIVVALLVWSARPVEVHKVVGLFSDAGNMGVFLRSFLKPDFHDWDLYARGMVETVQIAIWGTALAVLLGVPFALLSASNVAPAWIVLPVRRLMDACRAINEIVLALLFVVAVGLGPFAGVMALFVHNTGIIAKLFSEAVEAIEPRPVEGIRATGASRLQEIVFGVIPQVIPLWSSFTLYRFETNVRAATVLGIIGGGGIGQYLHEAISSFQYGQTSAIILIVIATVMLIDMVSARLRAVLV